MTVQQHHLIVEFCSETVDDEVEVDFGYIAKINFIEIAVCHSVHFRGFCTLGRSEKSVELLVKLQYI